MEFSTFYIDYNQSYLQHHGILGMKWGRRRYQNPDGTLTEAGKKRYMKDGELTRAGEKRMNETAQEKVVEKSKQATSGAKSSELSDEELKERTARLLLENNYNSALSAYNTNKKKNKEPSNAQKIKEVMSAIQTASNKAKENEKKRAIENAFKKELENYEKMSPEDQKKKKQEYEFMNAFAQTVTNYTKSTHRTLAGKTAMEKILDTVGGMAALGMGAASLLEKFGVNMDD